MTPPDDGGPDADARRERGLEHEALAEMAEEERDRTLTMQVAFLERLWAGEAVTVRVVGRAFDGVVVHVGDDLVTLLGPDEELVDVRMGAVLSVTSSRAEGGALRALEHVDPVRFVARIRELRNDEARVVVGAELGARELTGHFVRVHADHVVFAADDASEWLLPLTTIAYVRRKPRARRD